MPRPSPENDIESIPWSYNTFGTLYTGYDDVVVRSRTYWSHNALGFPEVRPLPFQNHYVTLRRSLYDPNWHWKVTQHAWWGDVVQFDVTAVSLSGAGFPAPIDHVTSRMLYDGADYRARAKVISDIQRIKANVAQNVAEYRQVSRMFATNVRRVTNAYRAIRRGDIDGLDRAIKLRKRHKQSLLNRGPLDVRGNAPSIWLECQYGWRPLLGDVYSGITNFYRRVEEGYPIRAFGRASYKEVSTNQLSTPAGVGTFDDLTERRSFCKYIIEYEVDDANLANADDWGITNPALLAWELVPYSFVVDWFYPVGDWLSQVGYSLGLHFRRGMRTSICKAQTHRRWKPKEPPLGYTWECRGNDVHESVVWHREVLGNFPSPGKPRLDPDGLRGKRVLNALSLLALAFDRKPRKR